MTIELDRNSIGGGELGSNRSRWVIDWIFNIHFDQVDVNRLIKNVEIVPV